MFKKIDAIVVFVEDLDKCTAFYRDVVGLTPVFSDDASVDFNLGGQDFLLLKLPAAVDMIDEPSVVSKGRVGHGVLLCAGVENVDDTYRELTAKGVVFIKPPKDQAWGRRTTYFTDPEGNLWELFHMLPGGQ